MPDLRTDDIFQEWNNLWQYFLTFANPIETERCQSGRMGRSRKPLYSHGYQGFESLSLRYSIMVPRVAGHFLFPGPNSQTCLSYWSREIKNNSRRLVP